MKSKIFNALDSASSCRPFQLFLKASKIMERVLPKRARDCIIDSKELDLTGLSGGDIKNIALNAAGIAVKGNSRKITQQHIKEAIDMVKTGKCQTSKKDIGYIS